MEMEFAITINALSNKDTPYAILFTSPECVLSPRLCSVLKKWNETEQLSFFAVDEAHCIDVWGVAFRPDFLNLGKLRQFNIPVVALTGTATERTKQLVIENLKMNNPTVIKVSSNRSNLLVKVIPKKEKPKEQVSSLVVDHFPGQKAIIYCCRRNDCVGLAHVLKSNGIDALFVHGNLRDSERKKHKAAWENGHAQVMCATKSFGIVVDQKDIRFVIHMSFPESIEDYYQEIGRAGRDGSHSQCVLFFRHEDRSFHLNNIMRIEDKDHRQYKYESLNRMVEFCDNTRTCRHKFLMSYFQEDIVNCNQSCDICTSNVSGDPKDYTVIAHTIIKALTSLSRIPQNISVKLFIQFLFGSTSNVVKKLALDRMDGYGSVSKTFRQRDGRKTCTRLIYKLITLRIITETPTGTSERPAITISIGNNPSRLSDSGFNIIY